MHSWSVGHSWPHEPQFCLSCCVFTHAPPQHDVPGPHWDEGPSGRVMQVRLVGSHISQTSQYDWSAVHLRPSHVPQPPHGVPKGAVVHRKLLGSQTSQGPHMFKGSTAH